MPDMVLKKYVCPALEQAGITGRIICWHSFRHSLATAIARKALTDLATVSLEERVGEVFTRRLRELDPKAKQLLGDALKNSSQPALVRSAFELPPDQRAAIQNALNETFSAVVRIKFEDSQDAICGIELTANGQKVAWSIASYLTELSKKVSDLVDAQTLAGIKSTPKPEAAKAPEPETAKAPEPEPVALVGAK
jgi:F-type H+-transporting ATPase subunit b